VNRGNAMPSHTVGTKEEWAAARQDLLEREKELGALDEESAKHRQELPAPYYSQLLDQIPAVGTQIPRIAAMTSTRTRTTAGTLTIAAGVYELTPLKRECRRRCHRAVRSGFQFGFYCFGSSIGLMLILLAVGVMSVTWMAVVAALVVAQKLLPPRASIDIP